VRATKTSSVAVLPLLLLAATLAVAAPSSAQEAGSRASAQAAQAAQVGEPPPPPPPQYALEGDQLVIEGDTVIDCPSFVGGLDSAQIPSSDPAIRREQEFVRRYAELCRQYGFSSAGTGGANPRVTVDAAAARDGEDATAGGDERLPDTGGLRLPFVALAALLVGAGVAISGRRAS
jgi:hypothetical protein